MDKPTVAQNVPEVGPVMCDMCVETQSPALKTCLKCEISMCAQHLQAHLTTPVLLQTHPLTEAGGVGQRTSKCQSHGMLMEYYCLDDCTCVCVSCAIEDQHRLHNLKTLPTAHKELVERLRAELKELAEREQRGQELVECDKVQRERLKGSSDQFLEQVTELRDVVLATVQSSVSARLGAIQAAKSAVQAVLEKEHAFALLQMFSSVNHALEKAHKVDLREGLVPGADRDSLIQEIRQKGRKITNNMVPLQGNLLALLDPDNHKILRHNPSLEISELKFDLGTLGMGMSVSTDQKTLFFDPLITSPGHTVHFGRRGISGVDLHWVMKLSDKYDWSIGLCDKEASQSHLRQGIVYGLRWQDKTLAWLGVEYYDQTDAKGIRQRQRYFQTQPIKTHDDQVSEPQEAIRPRKIEVVWEHQSCLLSFNSRDRHNYGVQLHSVKIDQASHYLQPFVTLEAGSKSNGQYNTPQYVFGQLPGCQCRNFTGRSSKCSIPIGQFPSKGSVCQCGLVCGISYMEIICELTMC